jgi:hypothetical protein
MPKFYGELQEASLENLASDPTSGVAGKIWHNTTEVRVKTDDGSLQRALLRNDQKAVFGNSGTAAQNIRVHRGAAGVLQFVTGDDATAEGSLSTNVNQTSSRQENYVFTSLPAAGNAGRIAWTTDNKKFYGDNGTEWQEVGSGTGGQNYITNGGAESGTDGWVEFQNAVAFTDSGDLVTLSAHGLSDNDTIQFETIVTTTGISVDTTYYVVTSTTNTFQVESSIGGGALTLTTDGTGTIRLIGAGGGSHANLALTRNTTTPLRGEGDFDIAKSNIASAEGAGVGFDFSVHEADKAKALTISFDYSADASFDYGDGTSADPSDLVVWMYDVTNSLLIQPTPYILDGSGRFEAQFQTSSDGDDYRLILECPNTNALNWNFNFDNVSVGPSAFTQGNIMTDWETFTPSWNGAMTPTDVGMRWKRVGQDMHIQGVFVLGAIDGSPAYFTLPNGASVDNTNMQGSAQKLGHGRLLSTGAGTLTLVDVTIDGTNDTRLYLTNGGNATLDEYDLEDWNQLGNNGDRVTFQASFPITGWGSSTEVSSDSSTRVVAVSANAPTNGATAGTGTPFTFNTIKDTHGAMDAAVDGSVFTAPISGFYNFSGAIRVTVATADTVTFAVDGTVLYNIGETSSAVMKTFSAGYYLNAGQTAEIRCTNTHTQEDAASQPDSWIEIRRTSGPSQIAANELVAMKANMTAAENIENGSALMLFDGTDFDTHGGFDDAGSYTCPVSGIYRVDAGVASISNTLDGNLVLELYKDTGGGAALEQTLGMSTVEYDVTAFRNMVSGSCLVKCNAGDVLQIWADHESSQVAADEANCYFCVQRVGF